MPDPYTFRARTQPTDGGYLHMAIVVVPEDVVEALGGNSVKRVLCTLNGHALRRGLLPMRTGERYLMLSKDLRKQLNLQLGDEVTVTLAADPHPEQVDLPEELADGLAEWPEADEAFRRLTPGRQRNLVHYIEQARQADTRARRVVELLHKLANGEYTARPAREK